MKKNCKNPVVCWFLFVPTVFVLSLFTASCVEAAKPQITFSANPELIDPGQTTTLLWSVVDAVGCQMRENDGEWHDVAVSGEQVTDSLFDYTTYDLNCLGDDLQETEESVAVAVAPLPEVTFTADSTLVDYNTGTTLHWTSTNADSCIASCDWEGEKGLSGTFDTGNLISEKEYKLTCSGGGGTVEKLVVVAVGSPINAPSLNFSADDYILEHDTGTTLRWTSLDAEICTAFGTWDGIKELNGFEDTGNLVRPRYGDPINFVMECVGEGGSFMGFIDIFVEAEPTFPVELTFTVDDPFVPYEGSTTLRWEATHAESCTASRAWCGNKPTSGTYDTGTLVMTKPYSLTCKGFDDSTVTREISVQVGHNPHPPPTLDFSVDESSIPFNTSTTLRWSAEDAFFGLEAELDWSGDLAVEGSYDTGNLTEGQNDYRIFARGKGGSLCETVSVYVDDPLNPPLVAFWADDNNIPYNSGTTLHWTSSFADWCRLDYAGGTVWGKNKNFDTGNLIENVIYSLECHNHAGSTTEAIMIQVGIVGDLPIIDLTADDYEVPHNGSTTLHWTAINADSCTWEDIGDTVGVTGSRDTGSIYQFPKTFTMNCIGSGGLSSEDITIEIVEESIPDALPELSMWADQYSFYGSGRTNVHWEASEASDPESCWAWGDWSGDKPFNGTHDTGDFHEERTYGMTCENLNGEVSASVTLSIVEMDDVILDFWADENIVDAEGFTNLNWHARNAVVCVASGDWSLNKAVDVETFETVGPLGKYTNTYVLGCSNWTDVGETKTVIVYAGDPPPIVAIGGPNIVSYNGQALLWWKAENTDSCVLSSNNANEHSWVGTRGSSGMESTSNLKATTKFSVECFGSGGSKKVSKTVTVGASGGGAPKIAFWADQYIVARGEEATVHWKTEDADRCFAFSMHQEGWSGGIPMNGSRTLTIDVNRSRLMITCRNESGMSSSKMTMYTGSENIHPPGVSLWTDQMMVPTGASTTLRWNTENVGSGHCTATGDWIGDKLAGSGSEVVGPIDLRMEYHLECSNDGGTTIAKAVVDNRDVAPDMTLNFWAGDYDLSAGESSFLFWNSENASTCYASGTQTEDWHGAQYLTGGAVLVSPDVTTTYGLTCENPRGISEQNIKINVAKVLVCPDGAIVTKGATLDLKALYKQDADENYTCGNCSDNPASCGAFDVTNGYDDGMATIPGESLSKRIARMLGVKPVNADFFSTTWSSDTTGSVTVSAAGTATGVEYSSVAGFATVTAVFKETTGSGTVTVAAPPKTCWRCDDSKDCISEIQYPEDGNCSAGTYDSASACRNVCRKPADWREINL